MDAGISGSFGGGFLTSFCGTGEIAKQNQNIGAVVAIGVLVGVAIAVARKSGGYGGGGASDGPVDWDQFYGTYGGLTWRCREINTGRFVDDNRCAGLPQTDQRWPSKSAYVH